MTDDPYQGYIIARFQGKWEENRNLDTFFRIYPFLGFLPLVSFIAVMYLLPNEHTDFLVALVSPFLIIAGLGAYLVVQNILEKLRSPIIVHSNGIYLKGGHLDRLRHRADFIPRSSIKNVEIDDVTFTNPNVGSASTTSIRINTFDDWQRSSSYRDTKKMSGIREALVRMGASIIDLQINKVQSKSHLPPAASVAPSTDGKNYCDLCGERIVPGASFCSRCGKRL